MCQRHSFSWLNTLLWLDHLPVATDSVIHVLVIEHVCLPRNDAIMLLEKLSNFPERAVFDTFAGGVNPVVFVPWPVLISAVVVPVLQWHSCGFSVYSRRLSWNDHLCIFLGEMLFLACAWFLMGHLNLCY